MIIKERLQRLWYYISAPFRWFYSTVRRVITVTADNTMRYKLTPELNRLGNRHIARVVGAGGSVTRTFHKRIAKYDPEVHPIGEPGIRSLIYDLLKQAAAEREQLSTRIAKNAELGALYSSYYGKLNKINELEVEAGKRFKALEAARADYEFAKNTYISVRNSSYVVTVAGEFGDELNGGGSK